MSNKYKVKWSLVKLENRRVMFGSAVGEHDISHDANNWIRFKNLDKTKPKGERVVLTEFRLSYEAIHGLLVLFAERGIITINENHQLKETDG